MTGSEPYPPSCFVPPVDPLNLPAGLSGPRTNALVSLGGKWPNGTELSYHFLTGPGWEWPEEQKAVVRWAFESWKALGIGLRFREELDKYKAELRIGFLPGESWSWVGLEVRRYSKPDGRNMNFGWDLRTAWGRATALHEIGHAIGMPHEHQNPNSGIEWDEAAVYAHYKSFDPPWDEAQTFDNVIRKLDPATVEGSPWDMFSIMHYPTRPGLIAQPVALRTNGTPRNVVLSERDRAWVRFWYPPLGAVTPIFPGEGLPLGSAVGAQRIFRIRPDEARDYTLRTSGASDTLVALVEERADCDVAIALEDDSGAEGNVRLVQRLEADKTYLARVRINYAKPGETALFWLE